MSSLQERYTTLQKSHDELNSKYSKLLTKQPLLSDVEFLKNEYNPFELLLVKNVYPKLNKKDSLFNVVIRTESSIRKYVEKTRQLIIDLMKNEDDSFKTIKRKDFVSSEKMKNFLTLYLVMKKRKIIANILKQSLSIKDFVKEKIKKILIENINIFLEIVFRNLTFNRNDNKLIGDKYDDNLHKTFIRKNDVISSVICPSLVHNNQVIKKVLVACDTLSDKKLPSSKSSNHIGKDTKEKKKISQKMRIIPNSTNIGGAKAFSLSGTKVKEILRLRRKNDIKQEEIDLQEKEEVLKKKAVDLENFEEELKKQEQAMMEKHKQVLPHGTIDDISNEFTKLEAKFMKISPQHFSIGNDPRNKHSNRYNDNTPYNHNIVDLKNEKYINASHVKINSYHYIATQWPLKNSRVDCEEEFYQMVYQYQSPVIICLTNPHPPRHQYYWNNNIMKEKKAGKYDVRTLDIFEGDFYDEIKLLIYKKKIFKIKKKLEWKTTLLLFKVWPDRDVPSNFKAVKALLDKVNQLVEPSQPIVIHCSAGIGRTGCFAAIHSILKNGMNHKDIKNTCYELRKQRYGMVQNLKQYIFLYDVIYDLTNKNV